MSSTVAPAADAVQSPGHAPPNNKKKNNKKKKQNAKARALQETSAKDGAASAEPEDASADEQQQPEATSLSTPPQKEDLVQDAPETLPSELEPERDQTDSKTAPAESEQPGSENTNGHAGANGYVPPHNSTPPANQPSEDTTSAKLEAMSQDREALLAEVEQLRKQLETLQETHSKEVSQLKTELEESEAAKAEAEEKHESLLDRVKEIQERVGSRLKENKINLEKANARIEELEAENEELQRSSQAGGDETARLREEIQEQGRELASLRSRSNLSQQNWQKEKDDMTKQMQHLRAELESTSNAMGEWEVIAMEERSMRESLSDKMADLEEQLSNVREAYDRVASDRDTQSQAVDGLQRALQEIQEARKRELREMVETSEEQLQALKKRAEESDARAAEAEAAKEALAKELERTAPFEKEVKEKNLLIGKLRHEAIVLNDHLTKALKYIKKTKPEETIDRQIVTNHFLQFLSLDRSDPKKFQILQVIAGLLNWTDEQREQAGLARPGGAGNHTLRLPTSPFHRTPSSPALNTEFFSEQSSAGGLSGLGKHGSGSAAGESLADLWAGFLERSVEEAGSGAKGRQDSMSSVGTTGTNTLAMGRPPPPPHRDSGGGGSG
ncbi:GRIP domain containing protein [Naviculisporaceae sp. PSN 640]